MLERVEVLDVTLPNSDSGAVEDLAAAIQSLRGLRALTIRKGAGTYLNQPAPRALLDALADAMTACPELVQYDDAYLPLSADPALSTLTAGRPRSRPCAHPCPRCGCQCTPSSQRTLRLGGFVWGTTLAPLPLPPPLLLLLRLLTLLRVRPLDSSRQAHTPARPRTPLLFPFPFPPSPLPSPSSLERKRPVLPTALFLSAARRRARLSELLCAGTDVALGDMGVGWRGRATVGSC
ncbi:hypothetical protein B0H13DRAFT_2664333 [Mycena leptocephala]|nr:hypothetical protein B0H13DRAFT_2664333 [Mycena leptocephala]